MKVIQTKLVDAYILEPKVFGDNRGWFMESWSKRTMEENGIFYEFIQDNQSYSAEKGTLRGLHFQKGDASQAKLVRCGKGAVYDIIVDMREGSPTYRQWLKVLLSEENKQQLLIPRGFLHGFVTLTDDVEFIYKADNFYSAQEDRSILWNDLELNIDWGIKDPIISEKDSKASKLCESDIDFVFKK